MRTLAAFAIALVLCACGTPAPDVPTPQTVTITKTVNVYPPESLYSLTSACKHTPIRKSGTVNDMADALIRERAAVDVCLGDRAALRNWVNTSKSNDNADK